MKIFKRIDLQQERVVVIETESTVKGYAFGLVEDRAANVQDEHDEFSKWCQIFVDKGYENLSWNEVIKILDTWEYKLIEIKFNYQIKSVNGGLINELKSRNFQCMVK